MQSYENLYPSAADWVCDPTLFYHRLVETYKFAFSRRMHLGDSDFDDCKDVISNLTSKNFIQQVISRINDSRTYESSSGHYDAEVCADNYYNL